MTGLPAWSFLPQCYALLLLCMFGWACFFIKLQTCSQQEDTQTTPCAFPLLLLAVSRTKDHADVVTTALVRRRQITLPVVEVTRVLTLTKPKTAFTTSLLLVRSSASTAGSKSSAMYSSGPQKSYSRRARAMTVAATMWGVAATRPPRTILKRVWRPPLLCMLSEAPATDAHAALGYSPPALQQHFAQAMQQYKVPGVPCTSSCTRTSNDTSEYAP